ncbi:hypothetical protein ACP70R_021951 [Stipagrostis hirtigluma subsp. patula]
MATEGPNVIGHIIGDMDEYSGFINILRKKLAKRGKNSGIDYLDNDKSPMMLPVLGVDLNEQELWLDIHLSVEGTNKSTTLAMRKDSLYVVGFTGKDGKWFQLGKSNKDDPKLPTKYEATPLETWDVSYKKMMKLHDLDLIAKTLTSTGLDRAFAERAVRRLSCYHPDDVDDDNPTRLALVSLIVLICEAARMEPIFRALLPTWNINSSEMRRHVDTEVLKEYIWDYWYSTSANLIKWKASGRKKEWKGRGTVEDALQRVRLLVTSKSINESAGATVDIFGVSANFDVERITVTDKKGRPLTIYNRKQDALPTNQEKQEQGMDDLVLNAVPHEGIRRYEWFDIKVDAITPSEGSAGPTRITRKWDCRKQDDGNDVEFVNRTIISGSWKIAASYLVMSNAEPVKATVKVNLQPIEATDNNWRVNEKSDDNKAKNYTVQGKISARIGDFNGQIMLFSSGKVKDTLPSRSTLSLGRSVVMVPRANQLHIYMTELGITDDDSGKTVRKIPGRNLSFDFDCETPIGTVDESEVEIRVIWPTQKEKMETHMKWIVRDKESFSIFVDDLRKIFAGTNPSLLVGERPVLRKWHVELPPQWTHIELQVEGEETSTTLAIRDDILFGAGFMNQAGVWYSITNPGGTQMLGSQYNSVLLGWGGTYNDLLKGNDMKKVMNELINLWSTKSGKKSAAAAVRVLSRYPDVEDDDMSPREALAGLIIMICECATWEPFQDYYEKVWDTREEDYDARKEELPNYTLGWDVVSYALLSWNKTGNWIPTGTDDHISRLEATKIKNEEDAKKLIRLVCNMYKMKPPAGRPTH